MKLMRRLRFAYLLNKNADVASMRVLSSIVRMDAGRWHWLLFVVRWLLQFSVELAFLLIVSRIAGESVAVVLAFVSIAGVALLPLLEDLVKAFIRFKIDYLARQSLDPEGTRLLILDSVYWFRLLREFGTLVVAISFVGIYGSPRGVALALLLILLGYLIFLCRAAFRSRLNSTSGLVAYSLTGGGILLASIWVCSAIEATLAEAGRLFLLGHQEDFARQLPDVLFSDLLTTVNEAYDSEWLPWVIVVLFSCILFLVVLVRRSRVGVLAGHGFRSEYLARLINRKSARAVSERLVLVQLGRLAPRFGATELSFLVPFEIWFVAGLLLVVSSRADHAGVLIVLTSVGVQVTLMAVNRAVVSHYPSVFELGNLLTVPRVMRRSSGVVRQQYYQDLQAVLREIALRPCQVLLCVVVGAMGASAVSSWGPLAALGVVGVGVGQSLASWRFMARICCGSQVDAFEAALARIPILDGDAASADVVSYSGYNVLRGTRMVPLFAAQTGLVFCVVLLPVLGIVQGVGWVYVGVLSSLSFVVACWLTSRSEGVVR